jgi:hypothetical protein
MTIEQGTAGIECMNPPSWQVYESDPPPERPEHGPSFQPIVVGSSRIDPWSNSLRHLLRCKAAQTYKVFDYGNMVADLGHWNEGPGILGTFHTPPIYELVRRQLGQLVEVQQTTVSGLARDVATLSDRVTELSEVIGGGTLYAEPPVLLLDAASQIEAVSAEDPEGFALALNNAADAELASDYVLAQAREGLNSEHARARAAAARVLALSADAEDRARLEQALEGEDNKLARAVIQSALRALAA